MTYDPKRGGSRYLGMDDTYEDEDELFGREVEQESLPRTQRAADVSLDADLRRRAMASPDSPASSTSVQSTTDMPTTIRRPQGVPARVSSPSSQAPRAVPSPQRSRDYQIDPLSDPIPPSRLSRLADGFGALALRLLALALRLAAVVLAIFVVASAVVTDAHRATLVRLLGLADLLVPSTLLGQFVYETPFGGAFRGDLAIASLAMFVLDWLCMRRSDTLLERRKRGE